MTIIRGLNIAGAEGGSKKSGVDYPGQPFKDYIWPGSKDLQPWLDLRAGLIRYPVSWERCQRARNGPLSTESLSALDNAMNLCAATGSLLLIDIHNYCRRAEDDGKTYQINVANTKVTFAHYADFVGKLAAHFKGKSNVALGLMNEPHDLTWNDGSPTSVGLHNMYQTAIDKARFAGFEGWLTVCPANWGKVSGLDGAMGEAMGTLTDPLHKLVLEVHQYVDNGEQGDDGSIINNDPQIYAAKLAKGTAWAQKYKLPIFLGEFGVPATTLGVQTEKNLVQYLEDNGWWGYSIWSAGPWWPTGYHFLTKPDGVTTPPLKFGSSQDTLEARVASLEARVSILEEKP